MSVVLFRFLELGFLASVLTGRPRSFHQDAVLWEQYSKRPARIIGRENIPVRGPGLITINHYFRPGFRAWWMTLAVSAAVPHEIHWVMTDAWTYRGGPFGRLRSRLTQVFFTRIARIYGFTSMPPMPPDPSDTVRRANAVRRVLSRVRRDPEILVGLAPEGGDSQLGDLQNPPSGVGRFILHLAQSGLLIYPVGVFEEGDQLCLNFGSPYKPAICPELPPDERDRAGRQLVMGHIAQLLPDSLRGVFSDATT
jgi:1-acyl-sn-glycerol-3-phosphate acyltransferase